MFSAWNLLVKHIKWQQGVGFTSTTLQKLKYKRKPFSRHLSSAAFPAVHSKPHLAARDLQVQISRWPRPLTLSFTWLRDHCRCPKCYDHETAYKIVDMRDLGTDCRPKHAFVQDEKTLNITWEDDHETIHNLDWLWRHSADNYCDVVRLKRTLWDGKRGPSLPISNVSCDHFLEDEELLKEVINSILQYGLACVHGAEASAATTARVTERIAILRPSIFGRVATLFADVNNHPGSDLHISSTIKTTQAYLTEPGRIMVIHNLDQDESKDVLLADGLHLLEDVKQQSHRMANALRSNLFTFQAQHDQWHYYTDHAIVTDDLVTNDVLQFRFNRSTMMFPEAPTYHEELISEIDRRLLDCSNQQRVSLPPGSLLLVDNWRVALGFGGTFPWRTAAMAFIGHSDFMSKARLLSLIE